MNLINMGIALVFNIKGINNNIIIGNIEKAKIFCTAHYDTQAVLPFPNLIVP